VLGGIELGLELAGFLQHRELGAPGVGIEEVFDLLFLELGEVGFEGGADLGRVIVEHAIIGVTQRDGFLGPGGAVGLVDPLHGRGECAGGKA
jgi:hypothetical protein